MKAFIIGVLLCLTPMLSAQELEKNEVSDTEVVPSKPKISKNNSSSENVENKKNTTPRFQLDPNIYPRVLHWAFQLELGGGFGLDSEIPNWWLARARPGIFYLRDKSMFMLGATIMSGAMLDWGVGGQFEYVSLESGLSFQAGAETNFEQTQINASLGIALFGVEYDFLTG